MGHRPVDTLKQLKSVQNERRAYDAKRSKAAARKDKADAEAKQVGHMNGSRVFV